MGITFNDNGDLIVNDWNGSVHITNPDTGALVSTLITGLNNTQWNGLAPDGTLIVDDYGNQTLGRYHPSDGTFQGQFANVGVMPEKFVFHTIPEPAAVGGCLISVGIAIGMMRHHRNVRIA